MMMMMKCPQQNYMSVTSHLRHGFMLQRPFFSGLEWDGKCRHQKAGIFHLILSYKIKMFGQQGILPPHFHTLISTRSHLLISETFNGVSWRRQTDSGPERQNMQLISKRIDELELN